MGLSSKTSEHATTGGPFRTGAPMLAPVEQSARVLVFSFQARFENEDELQAALLPATVIGHVGINVQDAYKDLMFRGQYRTPDQPTTGSVSIKSQLYEQTNPADFITRMDTGGVPPPFKRPGYEGTWNSVALTSVGFLARDDAGWTTEVYNTSLFKAFTEVTLGYEVSAATHTGSLEIDLQIWANGARARGADNPFERTSEVLASETDIRLNARKGV